MSELRKLNINNQVNNKELEQCGRRLCCCFGGVPTFSNINIKYPTYSNITSPYSIVMSSDGLLKSLKSLFREAKGDISAIAVDHTQGTGRNYLLIIKQQLENFHRKTHHIPAENFEFQFLLKIIT